MIVYLRDIADYAVVKAMYDQRFPHNYGCSQLGDDHENTKKILRDMVLHPNAGAVLVVGLSLIHILQGYCGVKALCDHVVFKKSVEPVKYMPIVILIKENIDFYFEFV